ncbi:MAG: thiamine pyrophosphate-binding protein [Paracoccaceae bacterium]
MTETTTVHEALADALAAHEVDHLFGLMGDANLFMVESLVRRHGTTFVPFAHEAGSVLAAVGYASTSGRIGVVTVTHGPALTNCVTALVEGTRAQQPVVLLVGDTPATALHNPQNIDQREVIKTTGAGFVQLNTPETATQDLATAFYRARVEKRPIALNMPSDFMWQTTRRDTPVRKVFDAPAMVPEGEDMEQAIGMLASARRPLIVAGNGAIEAREDLVKLAERLEAPLATTLQAKDMFAGHPNNIGIFGTLSTEGAYDIIGKADCVVGFGTQMHIFNTESGKLLEGKRAIQINNDPDGVGAMFHPDVALIADAKLTAQNFLTWMDEAEVAPSGVAAEIDPGKVTKHPPSPMRPIQPGCVDYVAALDRLDAILPQDKVLICDGGRFMTEVWCRVGLSDPRAFVYSTRFGSIGLGLSIGIGAAMGQQDKPAVLFTGDGGFMSGGLVEFNTAVRAGLRLIVIVANDAAYGAEYIQFTDRQLDPEISTFHWPSFVDTANALGGKGMAVTSLEELEEVGAFIESTEGPILIELKLDPSEIPRMRL